jgi:trans-aconitate methyltransferase
VNDRAYTFGDSEIATRRLEIVAAVFESPTRTFLAEDVGQLRADLALDLGCGPGHTTRLVAEMTGAVRTIGLDASASFRRRPRPRSRRR